MTVRPFWEQIGSPPITASTIDNGEGEQITLSDRQGGLRTAAQFP
jgi:hypothetical protein